MTGGDPIHHGHIRLTTDPPGQDASAYVRRGRVLLANMHGAPRKVEHQPDGATITVSEKFGGGHHVHVVLPTAAAPPFVYWGTWLTPTAEEAPDGYTGDTTVTPTTARVLGLSQADNAAFHSLSFYDDETSRRPTEDVRRFRGFNAPLRIGDTREFVGSSDNGQGISWDNAPTRHNVHLKIFGGADPSSLPRGGGRQFDLGYIIAFRSGSEVAATFKKLAGTEYSDPLFSVYPNATHWNCLFYKGRMVALPDASYQMSYAPVSVDYLPDVVYNVRIAGCFYKEGKICYVRSAPYYSPQSSPVDRLDYEEIMFADATVLPDSLTVGDEARLATGASIGAGDSAYDKYTWSDWVFNNDGSEAVSLKVVQEGANKNGGYFRVQIDWEAEAVTGGFHEEPNLIAFDWGTDGTLLKLTAVSDNDQVNPRFTFTLPSGGTFVAQGVNFTDLRHNTYVFGDYFYDDVATTARLKFTLVSEGVETVIYDETRAGNPGTDIYGNFTNPVLVTEDDEEFTVVAVSCQISPGNGWPDGVYNSNDAMVSFARMSEKEAPALNPILRG